jgi:hypothetical protein
MSVSLRSRSELTFLILTMSPRAPLLQSRLIAEAVETEAAETEAAETEACRSGGNRSICPSLRIGRSLAC